MPSTIHIPAAYREIAAELSLDQPEQIFVDPRLRVWRDLEDRDNSTLDATLRDGRSIRLHVKRDKIKRAEPMALEAEGIALLNFSDIRTAPLVAHGELDDGRTFVVTENLDGFTSADRLLETDVPRQPIFEAIAYVAAELHQAGLHHRDLYANHFYLRAIGGKYDVRLIDTARVRCLPEWRAGRWIVKDVAQLIFSVQPYDGADAVLRAYCKFDGRSSRSWFTWRVRRKAAWIERHDRALRAKKPRRNLRLADGN